MPFVVSGHLATSVLSVAERKQFSPQIDLSICPMVLRLSIEGRLWLHRD
jgi:hypothetical protein